MKGGGGDFDRLERMLAELCIRMPPVPKALRWQLKERDEWVFSTRTVKAPPADLLHYVRKAIAGALPDFALIARQTDAQPCALHVYLIQAPLQLFLQLRWGDPSTVAAGIDAILALGEDLARETQAALRRGRLTPDGRLTVVGSDFLDGFWEVAASTERAVRPGAAAKRPGTRTTIPSPQTIVADALRWCRAGA
ncbi:MAG: hypothetical protein EHM71_05455 [Zetaproteobacteria bacterium]|nr:MAG: hypothetical protein EHM71_05455 [Zetaproteobacteria bacterium]